MAAASSRLCGSCGLILQEVAVQIGCNIATVMTALRKLGVERRHNEDRGRFSPQDRQRMARMRKSGALLSDIAAQFQCHTSYVRKILRDLGVKGRRGAYSPQDQRQMADLYKSGLTPKEVAAKIGCCLDTVKKALREQGIK